MRHIEITAEMAARIEKLVEGANIADLTAFEAVALNMLPIRKVHPLYEGAIVQPSMLYAMKERAAREQVPMYTQHNDYKDPLGYVFHADVVDNELRVQFALDNSEQDLIRKVQNGTYGQVSVGNLAEKILCSECGWDYLGPEATFENIYMGVCGNGHQLRENGVHAELHGLDKWFELSLVAIGGAQGAHIVSPGAAKLRDNHTKVLAADGSPDKVHLISTISPEQKKQETKDMDTKEVLARLESKIEEVSTLKAEKQALTIEKDDLQTKLEASEKRVKELDVKPDEKLKAANDSVEAKDKEIKELKEKLEASDKVLTKGRELVTKLSVMAGDADSKFDDADADTLITKLGEYTESLKKIVLGGASAPANEDKDKEGPTATGAFRIRK